jgi:cytochrome c
MQSHYRSILALSILTPCILSCIASSAFAAGDPAVGEKLYQAKCGSCHNFDENEVGPNHHGVFNRKAGSVADYKYSVAVKTSAIVWNEDNLNKWLAGPEKFIPGQQMGVSVPSEKDRLDIIAYLKKESFKK